MKKIIYTLIIFLFLNSIFANTLTIHVSAYSPNNVSIEKTQDGLEVTSNQKNLSYYFSDFDGNTTSFKEADLLNLYTN